VPHSLPRSVTNFLALAVLAAVPAVGAAQANNGMDGYTYSDPGAFIGRGWSTNLRVPTAFPITSRFSWSISKSP
jgi:hypothetical protein